MSDNLNNDEKRAMDSDGRADAYAALGLISIGLVVVLFWLSNQ